MGESVEDYISIMSTMGNIFFLTFAIALASVKSETCTTNSGTACLSSSEVSSGYSWLFSTGSSCFPYGRRNYCFIDQTNYIYSCSCTDDEVTTAAPAVTTTEAPATTTSSDDTSGSDDGSSSSSSGEEDATCTSQTFDPNPDCSADQDKYCDAATYGADNTMCLYCDSPAVCSDTMCIAGFTDEEKQTMLTAHNDYRRKVAKGEETDGAPGPQPTAANMIELQWDDELARVAQRWAEQCDYGHDDNRLIDGYWAVGQNAYTSWAYPYNPASPINDAVDAWYSEVEYWPESNTGEFTSTEVDGNDVGHYTAIVWAETTHVGCGYTMYQDGTWWKKIVYCNYGPSGNVISQPLYIEGDAASQCPDGYTANDGLCQQD